MQIKTQLDIELNESDIKAAIALYLTQNSVSVSDDELSAIKFVNSRNDGIKANLTVSNEKSTAPEDYHVDEPVKVATVTFQEVATVTFQEEVKCTPDKAEEASEELLEASTVEDVIPSIDELVEQQQAPTTGKPIFGNKSLFGNK